MPYSHTIKGRTVRICWYGNITQADLDVFGLEMPQIGRKLGFAPDVLHTFDGVQDQGLMPIEAFTYSLRRGLEPIPNPIRSAIVADSDKGRALATVFKELNRTPNLEMKVFDNESDARSWLERK